MPLFCPFRDPVQRGPETSDEAVDRVPAIVIRHVCVPNRPESVIVTEIQKMVGKFTLRARICPCLMGIRQPNASCLMCYPRPPEIIGANLLCGRLSGPPKTVCRRRSTIPGGGAGATPQAVTDGRRLSPDTISHISTNLADMGEIRRSRRRFRPNEGRRLSSRSEGWRAHQPGEERSCTICERDDNGRIRRSSSACYEFKQQPCPATGSSTGACPGYVIDHIKPLACGGEDSPANMQWQTRAAAKEKDTWERIGCEK